MPSLVSGTGHDPTSGNRYRLPGITREGIAQLSLLETALWPLKAGLRCTPTFDTAYSFKVGTETRKARVSVYAPLGLQSIDEFVLWGLMGMSLSHKQPDPVLMATPYWIIQQLGMSIGGFQYDQLRASLERLAVVAYQNTAFYNPVTQQHERVTLHFFSSYLPTRGREAEVDADRAWRIEWSPMFFQMCQATGGTLLFDLDLYRVFMNVDDLTIHGLGFSADRPLKKHKYDLTSCIRELLDHGTIELGRGHHDPNDLFLKRGKGVYVVQFFEGDYFRHPPAQRTPPQPRAIADDPLYQPLRTIGVDEAGIRRIFKQYSRGLVQRWIRVTDAAMHEQPHGFPGFKTSPAAFLIDAIQNERMPPDWIYAHEKERKRQEWDAECHTKATAEAESRQQYQAERRAAFATYLRTPEGRTQLAAYEPTFQDFYRTVEPDRFREAARVAATGKVEREHFRFPDFGVWMLERHQPMSL